MHKMSFDRAPTVSGSEVCKMLDLESSMLVRWIAENRITPQRHNGRTLVAFMQFTPDEVERLKVYLDGMTKRQKACFEPKPKVSVSTEISTFTPPPAQNDAVEAAVDALKEFLPMAASPAPVVATAEVPSKTAEFNLANYKVPASLKDAVITVSDFQEVTGLRNSQVHGHVYRDNIRIIDGRERACINYAEALAFMALRIKQFDVLTATQVKGLLSLGTKEYNQACADGHLPFTMVGTSRKFRLQDVLAYRELLAETEPEVETAPVVKPTPTLKPKPVRTTAKKAVPVLAAPSPAPKPAPAPEVTAAPLAKSVTITMTRQIDLVADQSAAIMAVVKHTGKLTALDIMLLEGVATYAAVMGAKDNPYKTVVEAFKQGLEIELAA